MFKNFYNNNSSITFYFVSIICMALANLTRQRNFYVYLGLILIGILFFILGLVKRFNK
jgi:hypothetical protein